MSSLYRWLTIVSYVIQLITYDVVSYLRILILTEYKVLMNYVRLMKNLENFQIDEIDSIKIALRSAILILSISSVLKVKNKVERRTNVIDDYFDHYDYFDHLKILNFILSSRRRHRRRRQYEIIQKIFNETSFNIAKIYLLIISIQNKQSFKNFRISSFLTHFHLISKLLNRWFRSFQ